MNASDINSEDLPSDAEFLRKAEQFDDLFPRGQQLSIGEAFALQKQVAERLQVKAYKDENRFHTALRKKKLTANVQGLTIPVSQWVKEGIDEKFLSIDEITSRTAVEKLFALNAVQRRQLDRKRKAAAKIANQLQEQSREKMQRNRKAQKPERAAKKRNRERKSGML